MVLKHWFTLNQKCISLYSLIADYNHHATPVISTLVPFYITVQCSLGQMALFGALPPEILVSVAIFIFGYELFLFAITNECAKIARLNRAIEVEFRTFNTHFFFFSAAVNNNAEKRSYRLTDMLIVSSVQVK